MRGLFSSLGRLSKCRVSVPEGHGGRARRNLERIRGGGARAVRDNNFRASGTQLADLYCDPQNATPERLLTADAQKFFSIIQRNRKDSIHTRT
jgi:hypothetical protein